MTEWNSYGFQEAMSPFMEEFIFFHDFVMVIIVFILTTVSYMMVSSFTNQWINKLLLESQVVECIWTVIPALILIQIALPSLILLYSMEDLAEESISMKVIGHQWYWAYEISNLFASTYIEMDSYMTKLENPTTFFPRLLETDSRPSLPFLVPVRVLVTSADVLHSWSLPGLAVKVDAVPGRLNQTNIFSSVPGVSYGQCSEICGANHSFMPIVIEFVSVYDFLSWAHSQN